MGRAEGIVGRLGPFGKSADAVLLAQRAHAVPAACQDLVRVTLMADVPDNLVARRVEHRMQRDCQLDHAQTRAQMAAGL